jgi:hypothetical protein
VWTSRRKAVLAACRAARRPGTPTGCILARCSTLFSSSPTSRLAIPWFGLFARIVLRVAFHTCIAFAGRTDSGSGVRDALLSFRSRCLVFPDLVYFLFLVSKSLFSIFIRSWICFTFRAFEQCSGETVTTKRFAMTA